MRITDEDRAPGVGRVARADEADAVPRMEVVRALAVRVRPARRHQDAQPARYARVEAFLVWVEVAVEDAAVGAVSLLSEVGGGW